MKAFQIRLSDDEAALLETVLAGLASAGVNATPEALLEAVILNKLNLATANSEVLREMKQEVADRMQEHAGRTDEAEALKAGQRKVTPYSETSPEVRQTWFLEIGRTSQDLRAGGVLDFQHVATVEVSAKHLRTLRHILSGHRHKFEFLVSEGFNQAMRLTLDAIQAEQWREAQRKQAISLEAQPK